MVSHYSVNELNAGRDEVRDAIYAALETVMPSGFSVNSLQMTGVTFSSIYTAAMRGKELAGQERATGARGFGAGKFSFNDLRAFISLAAGQDEQFGVVRRLGNPTQQQALQTALSASAPIYTIQCQPS